MSLFYARKFQEPLFISFSITITTSAMLVGLHNGLLIQYIWPDNPYAIYHYARGIFVYLSFAASLSLSVDLLEIKRYWAYLHPSLRHAKLFLVWGGLSIFTDYYSLFAKTAFAIYDGSLLLFTVLAFKGLGQRHRNAGYLVCLYAAESLVMTFTLLENQGIIATTFFSKAGWQLTGLLYTLLGYIVLIQCAYQSEAEKKQLQLHALLALQQNEKLLNEAVSERTFDLEHTRASLETALSSERRMRLEQQQFISMITHELRTPLAVIDSAALNLDYLKINAPEKYLRQIHQAVQRIVRLIDNCLAEDRLSDSGFTLHLSRISPKQVIKAELITLYEKLDSKIEQRKHQASQQCGAKTLNTNARYKCRH